jgi:DNA-binding NarL/FixJ family response regulator
MAVPRVVIVDDHTLLTEALRRLLEPDCEVVGTYDDPRAFLRDVDKVRPDVAVLDISMPSLNGLDAARELHRVLPSARIIFLTMNEDADVAAEAFRAGASAYLLKRSAAAELKAAVADVMNQRYYITPLLTRDLVGSFVQPQEERRPIYQLTPRQREVLQLLAEGHSMKQAAAILNVSPRTIAFHKYRMMEHLRVQSTAALVHFAVREGLI